MKINFLLLVGVTMGFFANVLDGDSFKSVFARWVLFTVYYIIGLLVGHCF